MPAYNEERRIGFTLESYSNYFEALRKDKLLDYEVLIVMNNTNDRTEEIVKTFMKTNKCIKYLNFKERGKGFAVIEGFKDALLRKNNLIGFVDADCSTPPEAFYDLIKKINRSDGAIASRYLKESIINPKPTFKRWLSSRTFNILIRGLLFIPYRDTQCGGKLFKRNALEKVIHQNDPLFPHLIIYRLETKFH